jgi:monoamine oxidase
VEAVKPLDAIIIGAGFSGLRAGLKLKEAGQSFLILEARDRVGGRVKAGEIAGQVIDLGGMWTCDNQQRLMELIKQHGLKTFPTFLEGHALVELMGKTSKCPREDFAPALPLFAKLDYARLEGRLNRLIDSVDPASPQSSDPALDAMSFGEWIRRNVKAQGLALMLTLITRSVFCAEPDQISLLNWLTYLKAGGGLDRMIAAEPGGAQHLLIEGGLQQLADRIAQTLKDQLRLEAPVQRIAWDEAGVSISTPRGEFGARKLIIALAPPMANQIHFDPPLPHARDAIHQRMPMGAVIKVWIAYDRPFWRDVGLNAFLASDTAAFSPCFDCSPPEGPGLIAGFFDASEASIWSAKSSEERRKEVLGLLTKHLGQKAAHPIDYVENDWTTESWSRGCYGAYAPPGLMSRFGNAVRAPVGPIHWAGTETATEWTGYVEGALQAGDRAALEILAD